MKIGHHWGRASGRTNRDCTVLGYRYNAKYGWDPVNGEMYVVEIRDGKTRLLSSLVGGRFHDLWQSPAGKIYAVKTDALMVHPGHTAAPDAWTVHPAGGFLGGVWGLSDDFVFAWGRDATNAHGLIRHWNGRAWTESTVPETPVALHGTGPDLIYAVGNHGYIGRWNGKGWDRLPSPVEATLGSVFVEGADEIYAVGNRPPEGYLLEGSVHGWSKRLTLPLTALTSVAKLQGKVYVAAGLEGVLRLTGNRLEPVTARLPEASRLEVREGMLVTCAEKIAHTRDGDTFDETPIDVFVEKTRNHGVTWQEGDLADPDEDAENDADG